MSYSVAPYLVDLDDLRKAVGSRDEALLAAVIQARPENFASEEEAAEEEEIPLGTALRHLVMGETQSAGAPHQYGYALQELCRHFGEPLFGDLWCSIRWDVLEETGFDEIFEKTGPPVTLPPSDDFPRIGHLTVEEIRTILARAGTGALTTAAPSGKKPRRSLPARIIGAVMNRILPREAMSVDDVREILDEYQGWLKEASAKGRSLVFFYY